MSDIKQALKKKPRAANTKDQEIIEAGKKIKKIAKALGLRGSQGITYQQIDNWFYSQGISIKDPVYKHVFKKFSKTPKSTIPLNELSAIFHLHGDLIDRLLEKSLAIPNYEAFCQEFELIFNKVEGNQKGEVASYIPQLAKVDPELFAAAFCSVDGQRHALGDTEKEFCVQSCSKPITYAIAVEELGLDCVHKYVGREPSGRGFNDFVFDHRGLPHNPMINAGAILCSSLIKTNLDNAGRFEYVLDMWKELAGNMRVGFDNPTYLSEKANADRNFALGHLLKENNAFPKGANLHEAIDLYLQTCSISLNVETMSVIASTLANGGICPLSGHRVFGPETVRGCLSLMYSCGLYDYSGEYAFKIGMPAKSGVSGAMMIIVPNVMGICIWSPRLDRLGNSVRGIEFSERIQESFNFHIFDQLIPGLSIQNHVSQKTGKSRAEIINTSDLCYAAAEGDLAYIKRLIAKGTDPSQDDYDGRTPLHLAAREGNFLCVKYLVEAGADPLIKDRFGLSPLDEAKNSKNKKIEEFFLKIT